MIRQHPTQSTIKALFAKSGNVCAFPECAHMIVEDDGLVVGEMCHIEAAEPRGPRYNPKSDATQRRSYRNFILLCHPHHRRIDSDVGNYTVERLREMKSKHESIVVANVFEADSYVVSQVEREMKSYWSEMLTRQEEHPIPDLAVDIKPSRSGIQLFNDLRAATQRVEELMHWFAESDGRALDELKDFLRRIGCDLTALESVPYYENPFEIRNWELHNIGSPNALLNLRAIQLHAELLYLTESVNRQTDATAYEARRKNVMEELLDIADSAAYSD